MSIAKKIMIERARAGMTVHELAKIAHIGSQTISRIEKGRTVPRVSTIGKIAKALDVDIEKLINSEV